MCLAIPGEVLRVREQTGLVFADVRFGGVTREVCLQLLPDVRPGDFVLVHVGLAIAKIARAEAEETLRLLSELQLNDELDASSNEVPS